MITITIENGDLKVDMKGKAPELMDELTFAVGHIIRMLCEQTGEEQVKIINIFTDLLKRRAIRPIPFKETPLDTPPA